MPSIQRINPASIKENCITQLDETQLALQLLLILILIFLPHTTTQERGLDCCVPRWPSFWDLCPSNYLSSGNVKLSLSVCVISIRIMPCGFYEHSKNQEIQFNCESLATHQFSAHIHTKKRMRHFKEEVGFWQKQQITYIVQIIFTLHQ